MPVLSTEEGGQVPVSSGDRALPLFAISKLATTDKGKEIPLEAVLATAGISRRCFHRHFQSLEDALAAAMQLHAGIAIKRAFASGRSAPTPYRGICRAFATFVVSVAESPTLARLCFGDQVMAHLHTLRCWEQIKVDVIKLLEEFTPAKSKREKDALQTSVSAIFENLANVVTGGRIGIIPKSVGAFAYLILTPLVGSAVAVKVINEEANCTSTYPKHREWDHE